MSSYPTRNYYNLLPFLVENILKTVPLRLAVTTFDPFGDTLICESTLNKLQ